MFLKLLAALLTLGALAAAADSPSAGREIIKADSDWKFSIGEAPGADKPDFDDAAWRTVNLPHDWSIELRPDPKSSSGSGEGYFPAGVG